MNFATTPEYANYDVVIIGGAIMGSSSAWFLAQNPDFDGRILVVERDPNYEFCSTAHTNSCIRQQFSTKLNIRISQFTADFTKNLRDWMENDDVPELSIQNFGYMYLANSENGADVLRENQEIQRKAGAATRLLSADEIAASYPFYQLDDIVLGSHNTVDEGYFDGAGLFETFQRQARKLGVEYVANEVVAIDKQNDWIDSVTLASGETISCGHLVNASGPRAARTAAMAGIDLPVEPRKRFTWLFKAEQPLDRPLPLTIDPAGVHVREVGGGIYMAGGHAAIDPAVLFDDFSMDRHLFEDFVWPTIANRIPAFETIKLQSEWAGHYAYNTFDQNAVIGRHPQISNFIFQNGFSGHGLQQSPAMGRAISELVVYGVYRTLDMTEFGLERILRNVPIVEKAII